MILVGELKRRLVKRVSIVTSRRERYFVTGFGNQGLPILTRKKKRFIKTSFL